MAAAQVEKTILVVRPATESDALPEGVLAQDNNGVRKEENGLRENLQAKKPQSTFAKSR